MVCWCETGVNECRMLFVVAFVSSLSRCGKGGFGRVQCLVSLLCWDCRVCRTGIGVWWKCLGARCFLVGRHCLSLGFFRIGACVRVRCCSCAEGPACLFSGKTVRATLIFFCLDRCIRIWTCVFPYVLQNAGTRLMSRSQISVALSEWIALVSVACSMGRVVF